MRRLTRQARKLVVGSKLPPRQPPAVLACPARRDRVLLLAENHLLRDSVSTFLEWRGFQVAASWHAAGAMALVAAEAPRAAVLDYSLGMPETLRVADLLASMSIPILFFVSPLVPIGRGVHEGATRLETPVPPERLTATLRAMVGAPGE